jgi:hypothetical protein
MAIEKIWTHEGPSEKKKTKSWTHEGSRKKKKKRWPCPLKSQNRERGSCKRSYNKSNDNN